jgi:hypothetical protein
VVYYVGCIGVYPHRSFACRVRRLLWEVTLKVWILRSQIPVLLIAAILTGLLIISLIGCSHPVIAPYHVKSFENGVLVTERSGVVFTARSADSDGESMGFTLVGKDLPSLYDCRMNVQKCSTYMDQGGDSLYVDETFNDGSSRIERFEIIKITEAK